MFDDPAAAASRLGDLPVSPVDGVAVERFPLLDTETGEELVTVEPKSDDAPRRDSTKPPRRGGVALRALGVHLVAVVVFGVGAMVVLAQLGHAPSPSDVQAFQGQAEDLRQRLENRQISSEEAEVEGRRLLERSGLARLLLLVSGPVLLGFFVAGVVVGRLFRPARLLEVSFAGLVFGGLCSLCLISPLVWPAAVGLSLLGTIVGRRWR